MKKGIITVATCQFSTCSDVKTNARRIRKQITSAKALGADVVHFHECALSGYAGKEVLSWQGYDWDGLRSETESICALAKKEKVWVVLGSSHPLSGRHRPHNSLYAIDDNGEIVERYDKRFCTGGDLKSYSPGDHFSIFTINGVRCGLLICYDVRFPELYRNYRLLGVQCIFHSFYNARAQGPGIHTVIMRPSLQTRAATNYMWISATNSSGYYQSWPGVFVRPDGVIVGSLKTNRAGVMVNKIDTGVKLYDASAPFRDRAIRGMLHSGKRIQDPRSRNRQAL